MWQSTMPLGTKPTVKVTVVNGGKKASIYVCDRKDHYEEFFSQIKNILIQRNYPLREFRLFWIDSDLDEIDVTNNNDFRAFTAACNQQRLYISYLEEEQKEREEKAQATARANAMRNGFVHKGVTCDGCNIREIKGFRYKCLECGDYDLCGNCEAKHMHKEHLMLRMPDDNFPEDMLDMTGGLEMLRSSTRKRSARRGCPFVLAPASMAKAGNKKSPTSPTGEQSPNSPGETADEKKSRKRSKQQQTNMRCPATGFSKLFDMLNDLAEGGAQAATTATNNAAASTSAAMYTASDAVAAAAAAANASVEAAKLATQAANNSAQNLFKSDDQSDENGNNKRMKTGLQPMVGVNALEHMDPYYMKKGIEIMSNLSDMFGKMLDTMETCDAATSTKGDSLQASVSSTASAVVTETEAPKQPDVASTPSSENVENNVAERRSNSIEGDWQMVGDQQGAAAAAATSPVASTPDLIETTPANNNGIVNYEQLSKDLLEHVKIQDDSTDHEESVKVTSKAARDVLVASNAPPAPPAAKPERRAIPVFHADKRINDAVLAMMAMGFSNEGGWLTQLLESTEGNIPVALDVMGVAKRANME